MLPLLLPFVLSADPTPDNRPPIPVIALQRTEPISFEKDVLPILEAKCLACHAGTVRRGKYDMGTADGILKGGKTGPAVVPGKSAESLLTQLAGRTKAPFMPPPTEEALTPQELALLKLWIDQGAKGAAVARSRPAVVLRPLPARVQPVRALTLSRDSALLAAGHGNRIHLYDPKTGATVRTLTAPDTQPPAAHAAIVDALALSPDGRTLASGSFREVVLWDVATGELKQRLTNFADRVLALAWSVDGKYFAAGGGVPSQDGEVVVFDTAGTEVLRLPAAHADTVFGVAFSPDGTRLATAGADKLVKLFEFPSGKPVRSFEGHTHHVLDVAWKADGKLLASAGADEVVKVWDVAGGEQLRTIKGHGKQVTRLAFVGTTNRLLTCSGDATARLWDADKGSAVRSFGGAADYLYAAAVSADGALIAAGGEAGVVRLYAADGKLLRTLGEAK